MSREEQNKFYDDVTMMIDNFFSKPIKKNLVSLDDGKDYLKDTIKNYKLSE